MTNQFDLLKSHIEAYTRKDGAVVGAHDDNRVSHKEGDAVKVTGNVNGQGKTGVIQETAPSGHFHIVKHSDGSRASYHESDLSPHDEDEDEDRDEDDEDHEVLKSHIEAYTRKNGTVVGAHEKRIEAHGVKGMKSTPWRKTFKSQKHFEDWQEKDGGNSEVHGFKELDHGEPDTNGKTK